MNLKNKLFAGFTALSMFVSVIAPIATVPAFADSAEDMSMYEWAFDTGMTTKTSFADFMFENAITREQAAKFLVKGAEALELTTAAVQSCDYTDLANADVTLISSINDACEMGIFKAQANFNPLQLLTREQAELTVARIVYGYDEVANYASDSDISDFAAARELLMADDIVKVNVPSQSAVRRGHLGLMLYRLADAEITEPGSGTPVLPGHAEVSLVSSAGAHEVPMDAVNVKVGTIKLTAGNNPTRVSSVEVSRDGLATLTSNSVEVKLQSSSIQSRVGYVSTSTNKATVRFSPALDLAAGASMNFDVYATLSGQSNETHNFKVLKVNVSNGTASGTPVSLGTLKTTSALSKKVSGTLNTNYTSDAGKKDATIAKLRVTFDQAAGTVKGFVLAVDAPTSGLLNKDLYEVFTNARAYVDGQVVGTVSMSKDKVIVSGLNISKDRLSNVEFEIKANVIHVGEEGTYKFKLAASDLNVVEGSAGFGMKLNPDPLSSTTAGIVKGYDIKMKKVSIEKNVAPDTSNALLYKAELTSATDFTIRKFNLNQLATLTGGDISNLLVDGATLYINGEDFDLNANLEYAGTNEYITVSAGQTVTIEVKGTTRDALAVAAAGNNNKFKFSLQIIAAENVDGDVMTSIGSITGNPANGDTVEVKAGSAAFSSVALPTSKTLYSDGDNQEIGRFSIKADDVENVTLKELNFTAAVSSAALKDELSNIRLFDLNSNTEISANVDYDTTANTVKFTNMDYALSKNIKYNLKVVTDLGDISDYVTGADTVQLTIVNGLIRNSSADVVLAAPSTPGLETYKVGVRPLLVTMTTVDGSVDPKFEINVKNMDSQSDVQINNITIRTQVTAGNDYTGSICILSQSYMNDADCTNGFTGTVLNVPGTSVFTIDTTNIPDSFLDENGGDVTFYALVSSSFIAQKVVATVTDINGETVNVSSTYNAN